MQGENGALGDSDQIRSRFKDATDSNLNRHSKTMGLNVRHTI